MSVTEQFPAAASGQTPDRRGQGTMVEQARAASQVQAAVLVAQERPRDRVLVKSRMLEACAQTELAEAAFYSYPRGGETVSGLTIVAASDLALIWGNIDFGLTELRRDDEFGQSEMLAYAWDMETNARMANTFIVPHLRETKRGTYKLTDSRDIRELNTNIGNRMMRAAIFKVLPRWYVLAAERALRDTLKRSVADSGKPLAVQIQEAGQRLWRDYGLTPAQLEHKFGRPLAKWTADDLVQLRIIADSLDRREIRVDEAFPQAKVTAEEIAAGSPPPADSSTEPLRGADLMRSLEAAMRSAASADDLERIYAQAVEQRDAGNLTVDEFTQVDVAGSQRDEELAASREADPDA